MISPRFLLALVVLLSLSLSVFSQGNGNGGPQTYCAPVQIDAFAVTAVGGSDTEGAQLLVVNGSYPIQQYTAALTDTYNGPNIFFRVVLTNASTTNVQGTVGVQYYIALNNVYKTTTGGLPQAFTNTAGNQDIEFFNWAPSNRFNNTIQLNVTETITIGDDVTFCSYVYRILIFTPRNGSTAGLVVGDPQFVGLRGQSFQVHGVDGAVYNLISDKSMQLNSRFTFLEGPRPCPVMPSTGMVSAACWSHPGSYLSELGLMTIGGSKLQIVSGDAATGFSAVTLDGKVLSIGSTGALSFTGSALSAGSVSVDNSHEITIKAGHFNLVIENNDGFVNLRQVSVPSASWSKLASHGLLGQTWQNKRYDGKIKEIEGDVDDYLVEDDNLFGDAFLFNRFTQ